MDNTQNWGMNNTNTERKGKIYKPRITTTIILGYAIFNMLIGIILIIIGIVGIIDEKKNFIYGITAINFIIYGFSIILASSLIYIIGALSKDVYDMVYFMDYMSARNDIFHHSMIEHLQQMEMNQESIKSGIAVISSQLGERYENTRRSGRYRDSNQTRSDNEQ